MWRRVFLAGALLGLLVACARPEATPREAAQLFLDRIHRGETQAAFESSSFSFQAQQNPKFFAERLFEYGLGEAQITLSPEESDGKSAKFKADIIRKDGLKYVLILTLEKENGAWRVYSFRPPRSARTGISEDRFSIVGKSPTINTAATMSVPEEAVVVRLADESMNLFAEAILKRSFTDFYEHTAVAWQKELTEQKLTNAFHAFIEKEVDMSGIKGKRPIFDLPPQIGSDGLLAVTGYYATKPFEVHFSLRFIYELPEWKLLGLNCYLRNLDDPKEGAPAKATPAPATPPPATP